ncbi:hypothetical protein [Microcoleus sp. herbarium14]|uniref:hypothetical protein n=1 Tax=Microcoleus sp. herbarium14 TaxID=3055439 RepID=UPI002FD11CA0
MELRRALGYDCVTIQAADSTGLADEKVLGFAFGEKLEKEKFVGVSRGVAIAPRTAKKEQKSSIVRASQPEGRSRQQPLLLLSRLASTLPGPPKSQRTSPQKLSRL